MFRQTIILACLIALAASSDSDWFEIGTRVDGDQNIHNRTSRSYPSDLPRVHVVYTAFDAGDTNSYFTYSRFDVEEGFDDVTVHGSDNGFKLAITKYNTTQLTVIATIYGFSSGSAETPINFVSKKINSKILNVN